jgi:transcriptional regulator with XRE-family HTH domain
MDLRQFGGRLKELRVQAGLSQKQLAEQAGLSLRAVSHWEQGLREPGWFSVLRLARTLGVDSRAFEQPPAAVPEPRRGRPVKAKKTTARRNAD